MKRKIAICLIIGLSLVLVGCAKKEVKPASADSTSIEKGSDIEEPDNTKDEDKSSVGVADNGDDSTIINLYYVEDYTGDIISKPIEIARLDEGNIWIELQKSGVLSEECQLLSMEIDGDAGNIILDCNDAFVERLKSMGTAGENEIIMCVVNTYCDAFHAEAVKITESGADISTGHASYEGFIKKQ